MIFSPLKHKVIAKHQTQTLGSVYMMQNKVCV